MNTLYFSSSIIVIGIIKSNSSYVYVLNNLLSTYFSFFITTLLKELVRIRI